MDLRVEADLSTCSKLLLAGEERGDAADTALLILPETSDVRCSTDVNARVCAWARELGAKAGPMLGCSGEASRKKRRYIRN